MILLLQQKAWPTEKGINNHQHLLCIRPCEANSWQIAVAKARAARYQLSKSADHPDCHTYTNTGI